MLPLRLGRLQKGLTAMFRDAFGPSGAQVSFVYNEASFEGVPGAGLVSLSLVSGPSPFIRQGTHGEPLRAVDSITITVDSVLVGDRSVIHLNEFSYFHDTVIGDTVTTIRDSLLAQIEADEEETATATGSGGDGLTLTQDFLGGLWDLSLSGPLSAGVPVPSGSSVTITKSSHEMLLNIQCFSKERSLRKGAGAMTSIAQAAMASPDLVRILRANGVALGAKGIASDISAIAGAHWETRTSFDVTLYARAVWVRPSSTIETVKATIIGIQPDGGTITSNTTITAP